MSQIVVPRQIVWAGRVPLLAWARIDSDRLDASFWYDAVRSHGIVARIEPLDRLIDAAPEPGLVGTIYPMSRCGSTLVVRQISAVSGLFALSEPLTVQQLLDGPEADEALTHARVRTLVALHRAALAPLAERIMIKWPLTMVHHAATVAAAMPEVPGLFLHREPVRVMASIARRPLGEPERGTVAAARMAASIARCGGDPAVPIADPLERMAHLVASACLAASETGGLARLDYPALPQATGDAILPAFGVSINDADRAAMAKAALYHSKDSGRASRFAERPLQADARVERLARDIVAPALRRVTARLPLLTGVDRAA